MEKQDQGMAVGSLVCGIIGLITSFWGIGIILAIIAVILGHVHKGNLKKEPTKYTGDGLAIGGLVCGYITIGISVIGFLFLGSMFSFLGALA